MNRPATLRKSLLVVLVLTIIAGVTVAFDPREATSRVTVTAYFDNTNGLFAGDEVRILGVPVGKIDTIEPQPTRAKVTFSYSGKYPVPADAKAVILSPTLVTARTIQLLPAYTSGPTMQSGAVIPQDRTAVPVEWDDFREQLKKLTASLQPTEPGGVSPAGSLINTAAANLRGNGATFRDALVKLSQTFSVLGDHSTNIFATVKNLSILVSALQSSAGLMSELNRNLAAVTGLLANDPGELDHALGDLNNALGAVRTFVADNREPIGVTSDKLASITQALSESVPDLEQTLHILPTTLQNFVNVWQPAQGSLSGALVVNNFANPLSFLCGAIQAASRLGAEQAAKLCVQYMAPILKNRAYNFPPIGTNLFVGAQARPNEITYSEDSLRPDFVAPPPPPPPPPPAEPPPASPAAPVTTDPALGLPGLMVPEGGTP